MKRKQPAHRNTSRQLGPTVARITWGPSEDKQKAPGSHCLSLGSVHQTNRRLLGALDLRHEALTILSDQTTGVLPSFVMSWCVLEAFTPNIILLERGQEERGRGCQGLQGASGCEALERPRGRLLSRTSSGGSAGLVLHLPRGTSQKWGARAPWEGREQPLFGFCTQHVASAQGDQEAE